MFSKHYNLHLRFYLKIGYLLAVTSTISPSHDGEKGMHSAVVIVISVVASTVLIIGMVVGYKYWQKKRREQDQARFLKLFEDGDDIEDELGLSDVI